MAAEGAEENTTESIWRRFERPFFLFFFALFLRAKASTLVAMASNLIAYGGAPRNI